MIVGKIKSVSYHRNGVSGEAFYCVSFAFHHNNRKWDMIATLQPRDARQTRVLCVSHLEDGWRGDAMFDSITDAVAEAVLNEELTGDSLYWADILVNQTIGSKRVETHPEILASDGFPMEKYDGLTPADHGTDTP